jgi:purine-binding chemotaxis protein CheW
MTGTSDLVEFELLGERYALDIQLAREIVEMMPITPIPRAPPYLSGIINLRGEITTILDLASLLGLDAHSTITNQKIVVLVPEAAGGSNVGVIVDDVHSVISVSDADIEKLNSGISSDMDAFVKGIIKCGAADTEKGEKRNLVIWIDVRKILHDHLVKKAA